MTSEHIFQCRKKPLLMILYLLSLVSSPLWAAAIEISAHDAWALMCKTGMIDFLRSFCIYVLMLVESNNQV